MTMESNLQGHPHRTYFQSPFYAMVSPRVQNISSASSLPYAAADSCCTVPSYLPYHSFGSRPYDVPCVYHPASYVDPQLQLAAFQGKNYFLNFNRKIIILKLREPIFKAYSLLCDSFCLST